MFLPPMCHIVVYAIELGLDPKLTRDDVAHRVRSKFQRTLGSETALNRILVILKFYVIIEAQTVFDASGDENFQ